MSYIICTGASLTCSMGAAPSVFKANPNTVTTTALDAGTIYDFQPNNNILPFSMCSSLLNPAVSSATAAANGVLTPQACTPSIMMPWSPGSTGVTIGGIPALLDNCTVPCLLGGTISIVAPTQTLVEAL
ncbi:MAG: DUF4280 domain-containing protein [Acidobacteriota bacterium]|nr:DUF4280 domain-containing protein [Acidobacteriota bacterium]